MDKTYRISIRLKGAEYDYPKAYKTLRGAANRGKKIVAESEFKAYVRIYEVEKILQKSLVQVV